MPRKAKSTKKTTTKKKTTAKRGAKTAAKKKGGMKLKKDTVRNLTPRSRKTARAPMMAMSAADSEGGCGGS